MDIAGAYRHCETIVRTADKNRFLSALLAPASRRDALFALYAFRVEIGRIPQVTREPFAAAIRIQWWRDVLNRERPGEASASPVAAALLDALTSEKITPDALLEFLEARRALLFEEPSVITDAPIFLTGARLLGAAAAAVKGAADPAGRAYALTVARQAPVEARDAYSAFRMIADRLPRAARPAFLPAALVPLLLRDPEASQWRRQIVLLRAAWLRFPDLKR